MDEAMRTDKDRLGEAASIICDLLVALGPKDLNCEDEALDWLQAQADADPGTLIRVSVHDRLIQRTRGRQR